MQKEVLANAGPGKGHSAVQPASCGETWARTGQKILEKETITPSEIQPCNFKNIQYKETEGPRGLCSQLYNFYNQWLGLQNHTKTRMLDLVVLEQLLALLPLPMKSWVRECGAESSSQAVALAEVFLLSQREEQKEQVELKEGLVSFKEVAVYFSEEEWSQLNADQKALYWEVMLENHRNVASLGNNGEEDEDSRELFQMISRSYSMKNPTILMEVESHERNHSNNLNRESSPSVPAAMKASVAPQGKIKKEYIGKCMEVFLNKLDVDKNCETQISGDYICGDNGKNYKWTQSLPHKNGSHVSEKRTDEGENTYECMECGKSFIKNSQLIYHKRIHDAKKRYKCMECGKGFAENSKLTCHKRIHTGKNPYTCMECGKSFSLKSYLTTHEKIHTGEKPYPCMECGKSFSRKTNLKTHERIHTGENPYTCIECGKSFSRKTNLKTHVRIHTGEKPFKCMECGKSFSTKTNLKTHEKIHTGEKPYKCMECGKCFSTKMYLKTHERIHTGEKPYKCTECGKSFSHGSGLISHKKIHTGDRPHTCMECGKSFIRNCELVYHSRIHTGEKPYKCMECGKCFTSSSNLITHKKSHTGEKYKCMECGKMFSAKSFLNIHKRMHRGQAL